MTSNTCMTGGPARKGRGQRSIGRHVRGCAVRLKRGIILVDCKRQGGAVQAA